MNCGYSDSSIEASEKLCALAGGLVASNVCHHCSKNPDRARTPFIPPPAIMAPMAVNVRKMPPLERARMKLHHLPILASPARISQREAICGACENVKIEAGKVVGCIACSCGDRFASALRHEFRIDIRGGEPRQTCRKEAWPKLTFGTMPESDIV